MVRNQPEYIFLEFDKAGAEWVVVAYLSQDANMLEVVQSGESPHPHTAMLMFGIPKGLIEKEDKLVGHLRDPEQIADLRREVPELLEGDWYLPRTMSVRQISKKCNHALNYREGYKTFALTTEIDESESRRYVDLYSKVAYPNLPTWWEATRTKLRKDRTLINCFGRKRRFLGQWGDDLLREALAHIPQSTVFDIVRIGMVKAYADESKLFAKADLPKAQVHDSLLVRYPTSPLSDLAAFSCRLGLDYLSPVCRYNSREFVIGTTLKIGTDWGHMHPVDLSEDVDKTARSITSALRELSNVKTKKKAA